MVPEPAWVPPRRVVVVNASGHCSGAESVMLDLVDLAVRDEIEMVVASPRGPLAERLPPGVRHVPLPAFGLGVAGRPGGTRALGSLVRRTLASARVLGPLVREQGTHTVVNSLLALPAVRLARPVAPPTWLVHDTVTRASQRAFVRLARLPSPVGRRLALAVAVSDATAAPLRALGCPTVVRPNGVPWPVDAVGLAPADPPVIGAAAMLVPWKGHRVLLEALALLPDLRAELAGGHLPADEGYVAELRARAQQPDLAGRVELLGHVDAGAAMAGWDVAVSASTSPEAGPLAVLEAMSIGLPVVATDHGGSHDYLAGGCGVLVTPGDPVALAEGIRAALQPDVRTELAAAARARVAERYDRSVTLPALYRAVFAPG